jgi:hypothetical protein
MEKDRHGKTTLPDRARRLAANGASGIVGNLALAGGPSGSRTIAGAPFQNAASSNYVSFQVTASASKGQTAEASGSSDVFADGKNGGTQIASKATAIGTGGGTSHAQVDMHFYGITTNRADLVVGSVAAIACCAPLAEAKSK